MAILDMMWGSFMKLQPTDLQDETGAKEGCYA